MTHPRSRPQRVLASLVFVLVATYLGLVLLLTAFQSRLIYFPTRQLDTTPADVGLAYEDVDFTAADGVRLHGWWVPAETRRGAVLFFHGNAGNISHRLESISFFNRLGFDTFIFDYRGYGRSAGRPSEEGTHRDAAAAWLHLTSTRGVDPSEIVLFGRSLGGAVATWLAVQQADRTPPAALILESTFTSVGDMARDHYPWLPRGPFVRIRYPTLERIGRVRAPVLVVHGPADEIIPFEHGRRLFDAAAPPKQFLEIAGRHNEGWLVSRNYASGFREFLDEMLGR